MTFYTIMITMTRLSVSVNNEEWRQLGESLRCCQLSAGGVTVSVGAIHHHLVPSVLSIIDTDEIWWFIIKLSILVSALFLSLIPYICNVPQPLTAGAIIFNTHSLGLYYRLRVLKQVAKFLGVCICVSGKLEIFFWFPPWRLPSFSATGNNRYWSIGTLKWSR